MQRALKKKSEKKGEWFNPGKERYREEEGGEGMANVSGPPAGTHRVSESNRKSFGARVFFMPSALRRLAKGGTRFRGSAEKRGSRESEGGCERSRGSHTFQGGNL